MPQRDLGLACGGVTLITDTTWGVDLEEQGIQRGKSRKMTCHTRELPASSIQTKVSRAPAAGEIQQRGQGEGTRALPARVVLRTHIT